jgi:LPXTG-motif cell wall-anchored protein
MSSEPRPSEQDRGEETGAVAPDATAAPVGVDAAPDKDELPDDQEELRAQIEETRSELGNTVEALSAKADVKGQVKDKVEEGKEQLRGRHARAEAKLGEMSDKAKQNPTPLAAGAGGVVALLLFIFLLKRRKR